MKLFLLGLLSGILLVGIPVFIIYIGLTKDYYIMKLDNIIKKAEEKQKTS